MFKDGIEAPTLELAMLSDRRPRGLVYAADDAGKASDVAVLEGAPIKALVPSVASYEYDAVANRAELVVNGVSQGTSDARRPVGQQARTYIGSHAQQWVDAYFLGSIYEIVVYNKALDADARELVFDYLSDRYDVTLGK